MLCPSGGPVGFVIGVIGTCSQRGLRGICVFLGRVLVGAVCFDVALSP